jgi:hypothetical protein
MIWICFSQSGSHDAVILPPGERFNRVFVIEEVLERCDERRSKREKTTDHMASFAYQHRPFASGSIEI